MRLTDQAVQRLERLARWRGIDQRLELRPIVGLRRRIRELEDLVAENRRLDVRAEEVLGTLEEAVAAVRTRDPSALARAREQLGR